MDSSEFRTHGHALVDWIAEYLEHPERYPVLSRIEPGALRDALPTAAPEQGEPFDAIFADVERLIVPALTHWNHPGFFAYFAITASPPSVLAEFLAAAFNQQAMLWRTSPAATEVEEVTLAWLRELLDLPTAFDGVIYDTASMSTVHALAAAREHAVPHVRQEGLAGRSDVGRLRVYCSVQAHSSVDKAAILLGLGHDALRRIPTDSAFRMRADRLRAAIEEDRAAGITPIAVVATIGTTSTTSVDPVSDIADICAGAGVWLHVDAAYAGVVAMLPELRGWFVGWERADSIVINPHKWLFVPVDLSALYCRRMDVLRHAFSLVPEYLRTAEGDRGVRNLMDTGVQLGRRFRALKLWMVLRSYGAERLRAIYREHVRLAQLFASWVDAHPDFERLAPVPFSVVCFRAAPDSTRRTPKPKDGTAVHAAVPDLQFDELNLQLIDAVNTTGEVFLSHTRLDGRIAIRLAIGHLRTTEAHVSRAWALLSESLAVMLRS